MQYASVVTSCDADSVSQTFRNYCDIFRLSSAEMLESRYPNISLDERPAHLAFLRRRLALNASHLPRTVPGTASVEELLLLTPDEFLRRVLEGRDIRCTIIRGLERKGERVSEMTFHTSEPVDYRIGPTEAIGEDQVRIVYSTLSADGATDDTASEHEDLRRGPSGEWRLVAHLDLLQSSSTSTTIPAEWAEFFE
jgi:hypothetical protein